MNLYEYKLVVGKIKVKKYEVTDGRTSYFFTLILPTTSLY